MLLDGYLTNWVGLKSAASTPAALMVNPAMGAWNPSQLNTDISRAQWQHFRDTYIPAENDVFAMLDRDIEGEVGAAQERIAKSYKNAEAADARVMQQYGAQPTPEQAAAIKRRRGLQKALDIAGTSNMMRETWEDNRLQGLADMINIGRGISGSAGEMAGQAAGMAAAREAANEQAKAAHKAQTMSTAGTLAGLGLALAFM